MFRPHPNQRRIDWLFQQHATRAIRSRDEFVELINRVYYKHTAHCYDERYIDDVIRQFAQMCQALRLADRQELTVVNIGGGTGFEYEQLLRNGVHWQRYFFLEPDAHMARQFQEKYADSAPSVTVLHASLEEQVDLLAAQPNKLIILSSCLHHIIQVEAFLDTVKKIMQPGDYLLLCHEPNNAYLWSGLMLANYVLRAAMTDVLLKRLGLCQSAASKQESEGWRMINDELLATGAIQRPLPPIVIRRIIDYWVGHKGDWKALGVPENWNEGFWRPADIEKYLGNDFKTAYFATYRHLGDPVGNRLAELLNRGLEKVLVGRGSVFSLVSQKLPQGAG